MEAKVLPSPEKRRVSVSEVLAYLTCGIDWEHRYVLEHRPPSRPALTRGKAVDAAVSFNLAHKMETGRDLDESQVLEVFSEAFDRAAEYTEWFDEDPGAVKDAAAELVRVHHREFAPEIRPAAVQERFVLDTDRDYEVTGVFDVRTVDDYLRDTKTASTAGKVPGIRRALQPGLYDYAFEQLHGRRPRGIKLDVLIAPTKRLPARTERIEGKVTRADHRWVFNVIDNAVRGMQAGVALPAPEGHWKCSQKWCGSWSRCAKGGGK